MDLTIFIISIIITIIFAIFGMKYYAYRVLSTILFILLGVIVLAENITVTNYFVATVNNSTQIVNTTTVLLSPPLNWVIPIALIFGGVAQLGGGRRERFGGLVHG